MTRYIKRENGKITGDAARPQDGWSGETLDENDPEFQLYRNPPPTVSDLLAPTEDLATISRKLEEVIDFIENATPLSQEAKDWMSGRKTIRGV